MRRTWCLFAAAVVLFVVAMVSPLRTIAVGSGAVLLLTAALWIPFGTLLVLLGIRTRFPVLTALMVWALLMSPLADRKPGDINYWIVRENNEGE